MHCASSVPVNGAPTRGVGDLTARGDCHRHARNAFGARRALASGGALHCRQQGPRWRLLRRTHLRSPEGAWGARPVGFGCSGLQRGAPSGARRAWRRAARRADCRLRRWRLARAGSAAPVEVSAGAGFSAAGAGSIRGGVSAADARGSRFPREARRRRWARAAWVGGRFGRQWRCREGRSGGNRARGRLGADRAKRRLRPPSTRRGGDGAAFPARRAQLGPFLIELIGGIRGGREGGANRGEREPQGAGMRLRNGKL